LSRKEKQTIVIPYKKPRDPYALVAKQRRAPKFKDKRKELKELEMTKDESEYTEDPDFVWYDA